MRKTKEKAINWIKYFGCCGWYNSKDGYFEIAKYSNTIIVNSDGGPIWTVVGETKSHLRISVNMINITEVPKKYVRILIHENNG